MAVKNALTKTDTKSVVTTFKAGTEDVKLSPSIVKNYLVSGDKEKVTLQEIVMFINLCKFQHLNPFLHEAYLIKYGSEPATLVVGKSALEKRAVRSEKYKGFKAGVVVVNGSGALTEREGTLVLENETLVGGWAEVYVEGLEAPIKATVSFNEYAGRKRDGSLNSQWSKKPATMIRKVAKAQAFREAFPEDLGDLYIAEEKGAEEPSAAPVEYPAEEVRTEPEVVEAKVVEEQETEFKDEFESLLEG